eukprot:m51a1_g13272 hypothetical protein (83) ;mRNA; r:2205-2453
MGPGERETIDRALRAIERTEDSVNDRRCGDGLPVGRLQWFRVCEQCHAVLCDRCCTERHSGHTVSQYMFDSVWCSCPEHVNC